MLKEIQNSHKILCICNGGNVRSVTLATILKMCFNKDALSCGLKFNDKATINILENWADMIITMDEHTYKKIDYSSDVKLLDVGEDVWHYPRHPELVEIIRQKLGMNEYFTKAMNGYGKLYKK